MVYISGKDQRYIPQIIAAAVENETFYQEHKGRWIGMEEKVTVISLVFFYKKGDDVSELLIRHAIFKNSCIALVMYLVCL